MSELINRHHQFLSTLHHIKNARRNEKKARPIIIPATNQKRCAKEIMPNETNKTIKQDITKHKSNSIIFIPCRFYLFYKKNNIIKAIENKLNKSLIVALFFS